MNEDRENEKVKEISIDEVIDKIRQGAKVEYEGFLISGDLDIAELDLPKDENGKVIINSEISIIKSELNGNIDFKDANFNNPFDLSSTILYGDVSFSGAKFAKEIYLIDSQFKRSTSFAAAKFKKTVLYNAHFTKLISFDNAQFELEARFDNVEFDSVASFKATVFEFAYFDGTRFSGTAEFQGTIFERTVEFCRAKFDEDASFVGAEFQENAKFIEAKFSSDVHFNKVKFNGNADFSRSRFERTAVFDDDTCFKKELKLDEIGGSRLRLNSRFNESISGQLSLKNPDINYIIAPWESIRNHLAQDGSAYLSLIRSYNRLEYLDDADKCLYQYRVMRRTSLPAGRKIADYIICWILGYGVRPQYPLLVGLGIIVLSAIIYWLGHQASSYEIEPLILSCTIFFTQTGFEKLTGLCKGVSLIESALGVLLMACFVISLAKWTLR